MAGEVRGMKRVGRRLLLGGRGKAAWEGTVGGREPDVGRVRGTVTVGGMGRVWSTLVVMVRWGCRRHSRKYWGGHPKALAILAAAMMTYAVVQPRIRARSAALKRTIGMTWQYVRIWTEAAMGWDCSTRKPRGRFRSNANRLKQPGL